MVNSVRDNLDKTDSVSEIKLLLDANPNTVCVLVEGQCDNRVLRFLLSENVSLLESFGGKRGVIELLSLYFPNEKRVIGIRDCDYCKRENNYDCFYYDYSCLEMMILSSSECYYRFFSFFNMGSEEDAESFLDKCFYYLSDISKIRKLNEINRWGIVFDGVKVSNYYADNIQVMNSNLIKLINRCNPGNELDSGRMVLINSFPTCANREEYLNNTNGHDFLSLFNLFSCKGKNQSINVVESSLYCTFGQGEFQRTKLYSELLRYQQVNNLSIVKCYQ